MKNLYITLLFIIPSVLFSQGGALDNSFGLNGKNSTCHFDSMLEQRGLYQNYYENESDSEVNSNFFNEISFYPNPNNGTLFIESQSRNTNIFNVEIFSILGQKMFSKSNIDLKFKELDLSILTTGTYFIKFSNEYETILKTLIIK